MKRLLVMLLLIFTCLLCISCEIIGQKNNGYNDLTWGMSHKQVEAKGYNLVPFKDDEDEKTLIYVDGNTNLSSARAFHFFNKKLYIVSQIFDASYSKEIESSLVKQYGFFHNDGYKLRKEVNPYLTIIISEKDNFLTVRYIGQKIDTERERYLIKKRSNVEIVKFKKGTKGVVSNPLLDILNLRPCPYLDNSDCPPITQISNGTELTLLGETKDGEWYKVKYGKITAFALADRIDKTEKTSKPKAVKNVKKTEETTMTEEEKEKSNIIDEIIAAANVKDYDKPIKGVIFVEEGANLNLRLCPQASDNCEPIDKIPPDTEVIILGETADGEWYKVEYQDITGFANSKFVIDKEAWDNGIRRSYVCILEGADIYDSEEYGELVLILTRDIDTWQSRHFSAFYENYPDANFFWEKVKLLIDKEGLVEKIELVN